jgi:membrane protease YdiL (CAAX protease family)
MHWDFALILIFLATVVPLLGRRGVQRLIKMPETTRRDRLTLYASTIVTQWAATAFILWRTSAHGIRPLQLGLALPHILSTSVATVILTGIVLANQFLSIRQITSNPQVTQGLLPQVALKIFPRGRAELTAFFVVVLTVSICEETIYRGFVLAIFRAWPLSSALFGIFASSVLFAVAHLYQGRRGMIITFIVGCIFAAVRVLTGSLVPEMVAHFTTDWTAALILPAALRSASTDKLENVYNQ